MPIAACSSHTAWFSSRCVLSGVASPPIPRSASRSSAAPRRSAPEHIYPPAPATPAGRKPPRRAHQLIPVLLGQLTGRCLAQADTPNPVTSPRLTPSKIMSRSAAALLVSVAVSLCPRSFAKPPFESDMRCGSRPWTVWDVHLGRCAGWASKLADPSAAGPRHDPRPDPVHQAHERLLLRANWVGQLGSSHLEAPAEPVCDGMQVFDELRWSVNVELTAQPQDRQR